MNVRLVAGAQFATALLAIATSAAGAQPPPGSARAVPVAPAPLTRVDDLHLTPVQQTQIRRIIASGRRAGVPTLVTRRDVFGVLTAAQREGIKRFVSRPARPL